jgi:hypothetical protein
LEGWIDCLNDSGKSVGILNDCGTTTEWCEEHIGSAHNYYKGADGHGWNFIFEFTLDDDRTGHGYFFCIEF